MGEFMTETKRGPGETLAGGALQGEIPERRSPVKIPPEQAGAVGPTRAMEAVDPSEVVAPAGAVVEPGTRDAAGVWHRRRSWIRCGPWSRRSPWAGQERWS